ncbi:hypothetical protein QAD02_023701, partial [Eretmocerus hayati]
MADMKFTSQQNAIDLSLENLFELRCLIKASSVLHAAQNESHQRQILAFVTSASDIGLYYLRNSSSIPIIKKISWFQSSRKKISCFCFDPEGSWLLVACIDGSLYLVPARALVDDFHSNEQNWTMEDVTSFSCVNAQNSFSRPSAMVWWQAVSFSGQIGIMGTEQGEIIFINLESGQQSGSTSVDGRVTKLSICQDTELDTVTLLITNHLRKQWYLVLEKPGSNYTCLSINNDLKKSTHSNEDNETEDLRSFPTTRSRLRGLKQLSVDKLVVLRQKLAETMNRNNGNSIPSPHPDICLHENDSVGNRLNNDDENLNQSSLFSVQQSEQTKCSNIPIPVPNDIYLTPQFMRNGRTVYTRYIPSSNSLSIHERSSAIVPSHVHQMPNHCESIILTSRFFYISDTRRRIVYIVSRPLSEMRKDKGSDYNRESIVARFSFDKSEEVINSIYTIPSLKNHSTSRSGNNENKNQDVIRNISDLRVHVPTVDTCIVVTNLGVYKIVLRGHVLSIFMDLVLKRKAIDDATKLGMIFGLNVQQLIEYAGDIVLCSRQFGRAMELYSLAGCRLSKSILKFASVGYTSELLSCLASYLTMPAVGELSETNRIHFSNLCILAFTELTLKTLSSSSRTIYKDFLNFLSSNVYYDELFALNIIVQTNLWAVLHHLVMYRGLGPQVLDVIIKILPTFLARNLSLKSDANTRDLLMCLSDPNLILSMLNNPGLASYHMCFMLAHLKSLQIIILQRLISLYNPTNAAVRPLLLRFKARRRVASRSSFSSQCDSLDLSEDLDEIGVLIEEIVEAYLQTILVLLHKSQSCNKFYPKYVPLTQLPDIEGVSKDRTQKHASVDFKRRLLSTGFAHTALIRNGNIYTWGNAIQGCLGTGPTIKKYCLPQGIGSFRRLGIEVLSVSCGRSHTLAVTNNGIYAWGGNTYGQLGLGKIIQSPNPELISALSNEIIVEAAAGQHHSAALTADGRLFTWGWGVRGQLGQGNTEAKRFPCLVRSLLGQTLRHVSAGYAHTLALSADGYVFAFGCNRFGQLGIGRDASKAALPERISLLPEKITLISTNYFHSLAISNTNRLYVWGSDPLVLRLQSKERKLRLHKAKLAANEALRAEIQRREQEEQLQKERKTLSEENDLEDEDEAPNDEGALRRGIEPKTAGCCDVLAEASLPDAPLDVADVTPIQQSQIQTIPPPPEFDEEDDPDSLAHLVPELVDTGLVHGKIVQISTGFQHSALLTKDGTVYMWGRNLDGQLGAGFSRDVPQPTPLSLHPQPLQQHQPGPSLSHDQTSHLVKAVKICCGSNFTIAIEPGGSIISWGSNDMAQLGRAPAAPKDMSKKLVIRFKSSKQIVRCFNSMAIDGTPGPVPGIPAPTISYQSYDVAPLAGSLKSLDDLETDLTDLTLHYALEQFHGLYSSAKILDKCAELKNYQARAKLQLLEHNFVEAMADQLKALTECDTEFLENLSISPSNEIEPQVVENQDANQENSELFERHLEKNVVETLIESVEKQKMKMPVSKSLDSFQLLEQELHTFDCQGGSEELFEDVDREADEKPFQHHDENDPDSHFSSDEVSEDTSTENVDNSLSNSGPRLIKEIPNEMNFNQSDLIVMQHAVNIVDFYFYEVEEDANSSINELVGIAINFWKMNNFPIRELEKVFEKHLDKLFYSIGLLLFGRNDQKNPELNSIKGMKFCEEATKVLSTEFCLKVCSLVLDTIDEGKPAPEYIEMLSLSMVKKYGPPLTGFPGTSENKTPEQMMDGIISTLSAKNNDSRTYIHIQ